MTLKRQRMNFQDKLLFVAAAIRAGVIPKCTRAQACRLRRSLRDFEALRDIGVSKYLHPKP